MEHHMKLYHDSFMAVKKRTKTIEMRLYDEKRQSLSKGDSILFVDVETKEELVRYVYALHVFPSFNELYQKFDKESLGYGPDEIANPSDMLKYYSADDIKKYGVVGIEIKTKKDYGLAIRIENTANLLRKFVDENLDSEAAKEIKDILKDI